MSPQKPSLEFLASLKEKYAAKEREARRLKDYLKALQATMANDARFIQQVENFIQTEDSDVDALVAEVSALIGGHKLSGAQATLRTEQLEISTQKKGRKPRRKAPAGSESDRIRELAAEVLRGAGRILSGPQILNGIDATGYVFSSKNPTELLKKALQDSPLVVRKGRGYWLAGVELPEETGPGHLSVSRQRRRA
ncbi:hypothetical protein [Sinorhizobium sp. CCBAU 05631]|uniref:hypothetical protein n=1 Tax=Sinorhizobium sp. CCBAU 05631 TaxID=794846 RepID=UPI00055DE086|nr:hypothetical protein [Sinorhizobium sp. CCBAU 05631]